MKELKLLILLLGFAGLFTVQSCKEECPCDDPTDPACENYDPCFGKKEINTFFKVRPGDRGFPPPEEWCDLIPCDTFNESSVRFDMPVNNPSNSVYEWQIGTEATPRTSKSFEISFYDYLEDNGWERHIPITLTIKTPLNSCMTHPEDTLIRVTRELFFTRKPILILEDGETSVKYKGYFAHEPNKEVVMEFIQLETGRFRGVPAPVFLTIGIPNIDTVMGPKSSGNAQGCFNYKSSNFRYLTPNNVNSKLTNYWSAIENIFVNNSREKIIRKFKFSPPSGELIYEFHGTKI